MKNGRIPTRGPARHILPLLICLSILVSACTSVQRARNSLPPTSTPLQPTASAVPTPTPTAAAILPETGSKPTETVKGGCPPTLTGSRASQPLTLGPINDVAASSAPGERLVIAGTVYDRSCAPVAGITLRFWQTDPEGVYGPGHGTDNMVCCFYGGETATDEQGRYTLITVMPGVYKGEASPPPAHIHVEGEHPSGARLESEIVFRDDPYLSGVYNNPPPIPLEEAADEQGRYLVGSADFLLTEEIEPLTAPTAAAPTSLQTYRILPEESSASYQIREKFADFAEMVSPVGTATGVEGEIQLDMADPPALKSMVVKVDLRGLSTDDPQRDEKLADRWLVTNSYPYATFQVKEVKDGPSSYQEGQAATFILGGDLTIRDVTRPVDFAVTASIDGDTLTGEAETRILMSDYGIDPPNLLGFVKVEDEVVVRVKIRAVRV